MSNANKALVNKKISQVSDLTPGGQLGLGIIKRAVRDIGTANDTPECWFDGSLDDAVEFSGINIEYVVRLLREHNLLAATRSCAE